MMNKISLTLLAMTVSGISVAGTMGPVCTPGNVTVPCEAKQWDLGVQALYLRPVFDASRGYQQVAASDQTTQYTQVDNDWNWGYQIEGSYHFNTGNDISLNWTHFGTDAAQGELFGLLIPAFGVPGNAFYTAVTQNKFDQVNLEMGQLANFGSYKSMRFYGGLQYAYIQTRAINYFSDTNSVYNLFDNADYRGAGPVVGIDYAYKLTSSLSVTANGSGSILYGTTRYNTGYIFTPANLVYTSVYASKKLIVPSIEAKIGLNYAHPIAQGMLNLEGGYQALNYFNALQGQPLNIINSNLKDSSYGLYGPYFGVKYVGAA